MSALCAWVSGRRCYGYLLFSLCRAISSTAGPGMKGKQKHNFGDLKSKQLCCQWAGCSLTDDTHICNKTHCLISLCATNEGQLKVKHKED